MATTLGLAPRWGRLAPPIGARLDRGHPLVHRLVACWLFNEYGGFRAHDAVRGVPETIGSALTWRLGPLGPMLQGAGSNFVTVSSSAGLGALARAAIADRTVEAWFMYDGGNSNQGLMEAFDAAINSGYLLFLESGIMKWRIVYDGATLNTIQSGGLSTGQLYQCVGTLRGTTQKLYINGVEVASQTVSGTTPNSTINGAYLGSLDGAYQFADRLGPIRVWARALTLTEIAALYRAPFEMFTTPRWEQYVAQAVTTVTTVQRRTLSPLGARVGSRQAR